MFRLHDNDESVHEVFSSSTLSEVETPENTAKKCSVYAENIRSENILYQA